MFQKRFVEYWDLIDCNGKKVMKMRRGETEPVPPGLYHATVEVIATDMAGHILITQRDIKKLHGGGEWEFPAGSVISGEKAHRAAIRELHEETGLKPVKLMKIHEKWIPAHHHGLPGMVRIAFLAYIPTLLNEKIVLQKGETSNYRIITLSEWYTMIRQGTFIKNRVVLYDEHFCSTLEEVVGMLEPSPAPTASRNATTKKVVKKELSVTASNNQEEEDELRI